MSWVQQRVNPVLAYVTAAMTPQSMRPPFLSRFAVLARRATPPARSRIWSASPRRPRGIDSARNSSRCFRASRRWST